MMVSIFNFFSRVVAQIQIIASKKKVEKNSFKARSIKPEIGMSDLESFILITAQVLK